MIPFEWMYEEISGFIKFGLLIVAIAVFLGFVLVWGISVAMTFLAYYGFTVSLEKEDIVITRGLLEKKRMTVPLNRVQSVRIIENPFRQLFGYAAVAIDSAGGGGAEGAKINLFPLVKKADIYGPLKEIFPDLILDEPIGKAAGTWEALFLSHRFSMDDSCNRRIDVLFLSVWIVVAPYRSGHHPLWIMATSLSCLRNFR